MKKITFALAALFVCLTANAGSYQIGHAQNMCNALPQRTVYNEVNQVGIEENFDLATPRRIYAEVMCTLMGQDDANGNPLYSYVFRAAVQKPINDEGVQKWVSIRPDLDRISYGAMTVRGVEDALRAQTRILLRSHKNVR